MYKMLWVMIMLDLNWLTENKGLVKQAYQKKGLTFNIDQIVDLDIKRRALQGKVDNLRAKRNAITDEIATADESTKPALIDKAKVIKGSIAMAESEYNQTAHNLHDLVIQLHNLPHQSVPSKTEGDRVEKLYGRPPAFGFPPRNHVELGKDLDIIDIDRAAKVSGARFAYLKNEAVILELALVRWIFDKLLTMGFKPMIPPVLVKDEAMFGTGFFPAEPNEYFKMSQDDLYLVGTAEVPLAAYHGNEILMESELPKKYAGFSPCFRREAGSYGKDTHGLIRVHQFDKVEMFVYAHPKDSWAQFEELANISEKIFSELELCFRKITINAGDLGAPNIKKYDFEAWIPTQTTYRELASCSHDSDFQARRLNVKFKPTLNGRQSEAEFVHTLNNTAIAVGRAIVAILENHQQKDGSVKIPQALAPYVGFEYIKTKGGT